MFEHLAGTNGVFETYKLSGSLAISNTFQVAIECRFCNIRQKTDSIVASYKLVESSVESLTFKIRVESGVFDLIMPSSSQN